MGGHFLEQGANYISNKLSYRAIFEQINVFYPDLGYAQIHRLVFSETLTKYYPALNCLNVKFGIFLGIFFVGHPDFKKNFN